MQLAGRWQTFLAFESVLVVLWGICFARAYNFYIYNLSNVAQEYPNVTADTGGDFRFSKQIVFCYIISFLVGTMLVWFVYQRQHPVFVFSSFGAYSIALYILAAKPERVIVMFPDLAPFIALLASIVLGLICIVTALILKLTRQ